MSKTVKAVIKNIFRVSLGTIIAFLFWGSWLWGNGAKDFFELLPFMWFLAIPVLATFYERHTYIDPKDGREEHIDGWSFLLVICFSLFYFAMKRAWRYVFGAILTLLLGIVLSEGDLPGWFVAGFITGFAIPVQVFMSNHYGRIGWSRDDERRRVKEESLAADATIEEPLTDAETGENLIDAGPHSQRRIK